MEATVWRIPILIVGGGFLIIGVSMLASSSSSSAPCSGDLCTLGPALGHAFEITVGGILAILGIVALFFVVRSWRR